MSDSHRRLRVVGPRKRAAAARGWERQHEAGGRLVVWSMWRTTRLGAKLRVSVACPLDVIEASESRAAVAARLRHTREWLARVCANVMSVPDEPDDLGEPEVK